MTCRIFASLAFVSTGLLLAGCGGAFQAAPSNAASAANITGVTGEVHGGSQPIIGAKVYLYAVSKANGGTATSLLQGVGYVLTGTTGGFSLSPGGVALYNCPLGAYVYVLALGGSPGLANGVNSKIALASGLGPCSSLSSSTVLTVDEVTTVAMAYAFANYATSETQIGTTASLSTPFSTIATLVNSVTGGASGGTAQTATPVATLDSLANVIAACVNSPGTSVACSTLMTNANVTGANGTPVDTFQAALNIEQNPTANVPALFKLQTATSPFQPALSTAPSSWSVAPVNVSGCIVPDANTYIVHTNLGEIPVELRPDVAPVNVANFLSYVNSGAYSNSIIHRVVAGFINQGGGYTTDSTAALNAIPQNAAVTNEFNLPNVRGTLAMALTGVNANSATNQFFFNTADNSSILDGQQGVSYTVIGQVVQIVTTVNGSPACGGPTGLAVMDAINATPTYSFSSPFTSIPLVNYTQGNAVVEANYVLVTAINQTP